ncbi:MAG: hypothetical protein H0W96_09685 [Solirubrobacterales bacterium]|nr:hypothetical protein [Solirubrobacterales bacterium]
MPATQLRRPTEHRPDAARRADGDRCSSAGARVHDRVKDLLDASPREGRTLEDVLSGAWEELSAHRAATCLVCDGVMEPRYGSGPFAVGGRCRHCRSELG